MISIRPRSPTSSMRCTPGSAVDTAMVPRAPFRTRPARSPCLRPPSAASAAATAPTPSPAVLRGDRADRACGAPGSSAHRRPRPPTSRASRRCRSSCSGDRAGRRSRRARAPRVDRLAISVRAAAITGRKRCWKQTPSSRPARSAASIIVSASRASTASGFSTRTWAPASSASIASGGWDGCGVQTTTTSGASASSSR